MEARNARRRLSHRISDVSYDDIEMDDMRERLQDLELEVETMQIEREHNKQDLKILSSELESAKSMRSMTSMVSRLKSTKSMRMKSNKSGKPGAKSFKSTMSVKSDGASSGKLSDGEHEDDGEDEDEYEPYHEIDRLTETLAAYEEECYFLAETAHEAEEVNANTNEYMEHQCEELEEQLAEVCEAYEGELDSQRHEVGRYSQNVEILEAAVLEKSRNGHDAKPDQLDDYSKEEAMLEMRHLDAEVKYLREENVLRRFQENSEMLQAHAARKTDLVNTFAQKLKGKMRPTKSLGYDVMRSMKSVGNTHEHTKSKLLVASEREETLRSECAELRSELRSEVNSSRAPTHSNGVLADNSQDRKPSLPDQESAASMQLECSQLRAELEAAQALIPRDRKLTPTGEHTSDVLINSPATVDEYHRECDELRHELKEVQPALVELRSVVNELRPNQLEYQHDAADASFSVSGSLVRDLRDIAQGLRAARSETSLEKNEAVTESKRSASARLSQQKKDVTNGSSSDSVAGSSKWSNQVEELQHAYASLESKMSEAESRPRGEANEVLSDHVLVLQTHMEYAEELQRQADQIAARREQLQRMLKQPEASVQDDISFHQDQMERRGKLESTAVEQPPHPFQIWCCRRSFY